jgi:hypothetical protein
MAVIPQGYAQISARLGSAGMTRNAYVTYAVSTSIANADQVAQECYSAMTKAGSFVSKLDATCAFGPVYARLGTASGEALLGVADNTTVGGRSLSSPPPQVAVLAHKRSQRGGRRGRGRMFIPWWIDESSVDESGNILVSEVAVLNAALDVFTGDLTTRNVTMCLLHEPGKSVPGTPNLVTDFYVDRLVATQRRRLGR